MASKVEHLIMKCVDNNESFIVEAGAGSGKTWSLVQSLFYILQVKGNQLKVANRKVACITYTNVAKEEIIDRIQANQLIDVKTIHDFLWDIIKPFQRELKLELLEIVKTQYTKNTDILLTTKATTKKYADAKEKADKYKLTLDELDKFKGRIEYKAYYDRKKGIVSHDDILKLATAMIGKYNNIYKIIQDTYPIIFIDEYQDTNQEIADALLNKVKNNSSILFGLFGDYNQQIYGQTIGKVDDSKFNLKKIPKDENYRCSLEVINLLNKLRSDIEQRQSGEEKHGRCVCYYINNTELDTEEFISSKIYHDLNITEDMEVKRLYLVTKSIAKRNGYLGLHDLYDEENKNVTNRRSKNKDELLKNKDNRDCPFANFLFEIEEMIELYQNNKIQKLLAKTSYELFCMEDKTKLNDLMQRLIESTSKSNIQEIFDFVWSNNLLKQPSKIKHIYENQELHDDFFYTLMKIEYIQFQNLYYTVKKTSPFSTDHGTKGAEFDNVICFVDDSDWKTSYNFSNYFDETDAGTPRFEKTKNMLYVICSRAKYNLALVYLSTLSETAQKNLKLLFGEDNYFPKTTII
ncbi:MAG: ATP-dependent DNA helicase PcrA [Firmicutes bacterium ADurb.Bin193]|nr:MAG: ATP-dependent DNA helicase PcrA [Firmicutes bacterium ADurb.Bin193]